MKRREGNMVKRFALGIVGIVLILHGVTAQELSERQDISIFALNYYGAPPMQVPESVHIRTQIGKAAVDITLRGSGNPQTDFIFQQTIGGVDAEIRQAFQNLGRFNVLSYPQRLDSSSISAFIDAIKEYREQSIEIPEAVSLGQQAFTEQDLNSLISSFIIVTPSVTYYQLSQDQSLNWEARIVTNFNIVNIENYETLADFSVETSGYSDNPQEAMREAVEGIASQLEFEIRSIEVFKIRTAIIERLGNRIALEFGSNMGIRVGDEYEVIRYTDFAGHVVPQRIALLRIREVNQEYSMAEVIYEKERAVIGDQVKELPRFGIDVTPYVSTLFSPSLGGFASLAIGLKSSPNRGFYAFRPSVGIEVLLSEASVSGSVDGVPVSLNLGVEYNLFLRRFRLIPQAYLGFIGQIPSEESEEFAFRGIKTTALLGLTYLLPTRNDNVELYAESGYELQFGMGSYSNVQGITFGGGVRIR